METETYKTEVEILESDHISIFADCEVTYTIVNHAEEHPYGNSTATHYYSEIEVDDVEILSWYRDFYCDKEIECWIPEHHKLHEGSDGLSKEMINKIIINAENNVESDIL